MSPDKYTGPWAPGMRDIDGGYPFGASLVVSVGAHGLPDRWVLLSEPETIRYTNTREESEYAWKGCSPDWSDGATVGALAGVVRKLYADDTMHVAPGSGGWRVYRNVHEDGVEVGQDILLIDGTWWRIAEWDASAPFVHAPTEADAWLAAYHAHRDAAGTTANDIEVIRG